MPRDAAVMRSRLQDAAVELFTRRGYDATTASDIAAHAGVTERTFFRHFADKREVFFDGETELRTLLLQALAALAPQTSPLADLRIAFHSAVPLLVRNRSVTEPRAAIIAATPALRERALAKTAGLIDALAGGLRQRGADEYTAQLCATVAMNTFAMVTSRWMADATLDLSALLDEAFTQLRAATESL